MKERPILFNGEMVRAVLAGRKTQTRQIVNNLDLIQDWDEHDKTYGPYFQDEYGDHHKTSLCSPYGQPGDRLWVRETFTYDNKAYVQTYKDEPWRGLPDHCTAETFYKASEENPDIFPRWTPSIHMPRWASRVLLEVVDVRVERVQDISVEDAMREGVPYTELNNSRPDELHRGQFADLWDSINGSPRKDGLDISWAANPWVWVVDFRVIQGGES